MDHTHCALCFSAHCSQTSVCSIDYCPNGCGFSMHCCKLNEHDRYTCPEALAPCVNANYGCTEILRRKHITAHIEHCSASTVFCNFSYERSELPLIESVESKLSEATHIQANEGKDDACSEPLLDEKFLGGDLNVQRKTNLDVSSESIDAEKDAVSLYAASYLKQYHDSGSEEATGLSTSLSMDMNMGVFTNYVSGASRKFKAKLLEIQKQKRTCIDTTVSTKLHYLKNVEKSEKCCTFLCNCVVRRDEFATHWKTLHVDIQLDIQCLVRRCPMHSYGCKFGVVNLVPNPKGSTLDYSPETDCFLYKAPVEIESQDKAQLLDSMYTARVQAKQELAMYGYEDEEESYDVLCQLPAEVLMTVCGFLDSQSLWHLSLVNHYLRKVCLNLVKKSGMVYSEWIQDSSGHWTLGPKVWSFSKVFRGIPNWQYTSAPSIAAHMLSCDVLEANVKPYTPDMILFMVMN